MTIFRSIFTCITDVVNWVTECTDFIYHSFYSVNTKQSYSSSVCIPLPIIHFAKYGLCTLINIVPVITDIPFFTLCTIIDSSFCSVHFLSYMYHKNNLYKYIYKKSLFKKSDMSLKIYNYDLPSSLYSFHVLERYIIYFLVHFFVILPSKTKLPYFFIFISFPFIQNKLYIDSYIINRLVFFKYNFAKIIIYFIQRLHSDIMNIQNYHIFLIYNYLEFDFIWNVFKNYLFVSLLYFLRNSNQTSLYYYYKAIKAAYYCETGYLFNATTIHDSIYMINIIIKEQRWQDIKKLELINALYILIHHQQNTPLYFTTYIYYMSFFTLWSFIYSLFSLFNINYNSFLITISITSVPFFYFILKELVFYILNRHNIKKVVKKYSKLSTDDFVIIKQHIKQPIKLHEN